MFPLVDDKSVSFIAWTTTPWTLPSNLALCVHPEKEYVKIKDVPTGNHYILMKARLVQLYTKKQQSNYEILETFLGKSLKDKKYVPLFNFFEEVGEFCVKLSRNLKLHSKSFLENLLQKMLVLVSFTVLLDLEKTITKFA
jgi:isoleucyl-tRNA synthetase